VTLGLSLRLGRPEGRPVVLEPFELGIVHAVNPRLRTIITTENPDRYGIRVGENFI
jgi:hypothetical protein